jgi:hypothetical protein
MSNHGGDIVEEGEVPERQRAVPSREAIGEETERPARGASMRRESEEGSRMGEGREAEGEEREKSVEVAVVAMPAARWGRGRCCLLVPCIRLSLTERPKPDIGFRPLNLGRFLHLRS